MIYKLINDNCLNAMKEIEENSIDAIITDPPYGIDFMSKKWDDCVPAIEIWKEALRVLKPGAFAFVMCTPRQDSLMKMYINLEQAGFNLGFTSLYWCYGSGFPKAHNISKAIDKKAGVEREGIKIKGNDRPLGFRYNLRELEELKKNGITKTKDNRDVDTAIEYIKKYTGTIRSEIPATPEAEYFNGWYGGFQPKPAIEIIIVCQKPMNKKTFVDQALASLDDKTQGKGCINIDGCRIPTDNDKSDKRIGTDETCKAKRKASENTVSMSPKEIQMYNDKGRFPANVLVSDNALDTGENHKSGGNEKKYNREFNPDKEKFLTSIDFNNNQCRINRSEGDFSRYFDLDAWFSKKLKELPKSVQKTFPCLIVPKPSKSEKNIGLKKIKYILKDNVAQEIKKEIERILSIGE